MSNPSMSAIAKAAGVSKNTVSLALRNDRRLPLSTQQRIAAIAKKMGYQRNAVIGELMARMRRKNPTRFQETIALFNANRAPDAFRRHPTLPPYVAGAQARAAELGYSLDHFWLHDPEVRGETLVHILEARGIRGVALLGMMDENHLPDHFLPVVQKFSCAVTGVRTRNPELSFSCADHHSLLLLAMEQTLAMGYRRPALVLDPVIDRLVEGRFTAGFLIGQQSLPEKDRIKPFYALDKVRHEPKVFQQWLKQAKPDVIFTLYNGVQQWIAKAGLKCPEDIGLVQLERREKEPEWAGIDQHNDAVGAAVIDLLVAMLHNDERGIPARPKCILIPPSWSAGKTVAAVTTKKSPK